MRAVTQNVGEGFRHSGAPPFPFLEGWVRSRQHTIPNPQIKAKVSAKIRTGKWIEQRPLKPKKPNEASG